MAAQTETEVRLEISTAIAVFHELAKAGNINTGTLQSQTISNYVAREATYLNTVPGDYTIQSRASMSAVRAMLAGAIGSAAVRAVLSPLLRNYAKNSTGFAGTQDGSPVETDPSSLMSRIYKHFIANGYTVQSRNLNLAATPSAGSNIGNGAINRLTVDAYGYTIEACHVEAKRAECTASAETGTPPGEEVFQFRGTVAAIDQIPLLVVATNTGGSGGDFPITAVSGRSSLLANPSFEQYSGDSITDVDSITSWTFGAEGATNYALDEVNYYRTYQGVTTPRALKFLAAGSITQTSDINNIQFDVNKPYYFQIAYNRAVGSATGTLTLSLGLSSVSVVLSAQTGWNILRLPMTRALWPHNFAATAQSSQTNALMPIKIQWTSATGTLLVDDAILVPMTKFDGHWYTVVGGSTQFVADNHDTFTWTDAFTAGTNPSWDVGILQTWFWRAFGFYLPSTTGAPSWADPAV